MRGDTNPVIWLVVGAGLAGWLLPSVGILHDGGVPGLIVNAFNGACIALIVTRVIKRSRHGRRRHFSAQRASCIFLHRR